MSIKGRKHRYFYYLVFNIIQILNTIMTKDINAPFTININ